MAKVHSERCIAKFSVDNYLAGFLYCGACGEEIKKYSYSTYERLVYKELDGNFFQCEGRREGTCNNDIMSDKELEKALIEYFSCIETDAEQDAQALKINKAKAAIIGTLNDKINDLSIKDREITDLWLAEKLAFDEHTNISMNLKRKIDRITKAIEQFNCIEYATSAEEIISIFKAEWNGYTDIDKSRFMFSYVNKIMILSEPITDGEKAVHKISNIEFNA